MYNDRLFDEEYKGNERVKLLLKAGGVFCRYLLQQIERSEKSFHTQGFNMYMMSGKEQEDYIGKGRAFYSLGRHGAVYYPGYSAEDLTLTIAHEFGHHINRNKDTMCSDAINTYMAESRAEIYSILVYLELKDKFRSKNTEIEETWKRYQFELTHPNQRTMQEGFSWYIIRSRKITRINRLPSLVPMPTTPKF